MTLADELRARANDMREKGMVDWAYLCLKAAHSISWLETEVNEQARLLGDSGSTEARLNTRIALLEGALTDALDNYEYYAQYAGEYLSKKHRVAEDIAEKRALLQEQGG